MMDFREGDFTGGQSLNPDIVGDLFQRSSQPFSKPLTEALFGTLLNPEEITAQRELTDFGEQLVNTVRNNRGPLIDLGAGSIVRTVSQNRYVPAFAELAGVPYIGVDHTMADYVENAEDVKLREGLEFPEWQHGTETYVEADMLAFLRHLKPLENGETPTFYLSGLEIVDTGDEAYNSRAIKASIAEMRRVNGTIILGNNIEPEQFKHEYLVENGYVLDGYSPLSESDKLTFGDFEDTDPFSEDFHWGLVHRVYIPNSVDAKGLEPLTPSV